jgi:hypothetical protein
MNDEAELDNMFTLGLIASTNDYTDAMRGAIRSRLSAREFLLVNVLQELANVRPARSRDAMSAMVTDAAKAVRRWRKLLTENDSAATYKRAVARARTRRRSRV